MSTLKNTNCKTLLQISITVFIVLLSRVPFLSAGYGADVDCWRVEAIARNLAVSGEYAMSRAPGHPVMDYICSLCWNWGPAWLNGLTAFMSLISTFFFALILRQLKFKNIYLPALAFAFTPVIFINSVNCIEHLWALAFILASIYFVIDKKPLSGWILLGIADGCRLNSAVMLIPILILIYFNNFPEKNIKTLLRFTIPAIALTVIFYIPLFLIYKFGFITAYIGRYPDFIYVLFRMFISVWGFIGFIAIMIAVIFQLFHKFLSAKKEFKAGIKWNGGFEPAMWIAVLLFVIVFLLLPHKAAYLIPIVPFVLILLGKYLDKALFRFVCVSLILSPFLLSVNRVDSDLTPDFSKYSYKIKVSGSETEFDLFNGPVLAEHSKRLKQIEYADSIISAGKKLTNKSVIVTGEAYPLIDIKLPYNIQGNVIYEYFLDSTKVRNYSDLHYDIYFLRGQDKVNEDLYNVNLYEFGGKNLLRH